MKWRPEIGRVTVEESDKAEWPSALAVSGFTIATNNAKRRTLRSTRPSVVWLRHRRRAKSQQPLPQRRNFRATNLGWTLFCQRIKKRRHNTDNWTQKRP